MKYYYTDPLAALWMSKHFGMIFKVERFIEGKQDKIGVTLYPSIWPNKNILGESQTNYCARSYGSSEAACCDFKFYIHPDSLHLLEPQDADILKDGDGSPFGYYEGVKGHLRIVERNGIPFMWPEVDHDSN